MRIRLTAALLLALLVVLPVVADDDDARPPHILSPDHDAWRHVVPGFIFNASTLLLDLEPHMGGFGLKILAPELDGAFRLVTGLGFQSASQRTDLTLGAGWELAFHRGRINPYAGVSVLLDFAREGRATEAPDWISIRSRTAGIGANLGVEVFLVDFLSLFAEYEVSMKMTRTRVTQSVAGELLEPSYAMNYRLGKGLGNNSAIGIVVYLWPTGILH